MNDMQPTSHPLKWKFLLDTVEKSGLINPDVWIEDLRRYGACHQNGQEVQPEVVCIDEDTDGVEASFSVITNREKNRIIIRHHY